MNIIDQVDVGMVEIATWDVIRIAVVVSAELDNHQVCRLSCIHIEFFRIISIHLLGTSTRVRCVVPEPTLLFLISGHSSCRVQGQLPFHERLHRSIACLPDRLQDTPNQLSSNSTGGRKGGSTNRDVEFSIAQTGSKEVGPR